MNVTGLGKKRFAGWGVGVMVVPVHVKVIEVVHLALFSDGVQMEDPCVLVRQSSTLSEKAFLTNSNMGRPVSVMGNGQEKNDLAMSLTEFLLCVKSWARIHS